MAIVLPHEFHDGVAEVASGVQVNENFAALVSHVETLEEKLAAAKEVNRGHAVIATQQARSEATYGTLATPDEVTVALAENGYIDVSYAATWWESVTGAARAAVFIDGNQLKIVSSASAAPAVQETAHGGTSGTAQPLATTGSGLTTLVNGTVTAYPGDVATGQALGVGLEFGMGVCRIVGLPAGSRKISVRFKASSGEVVVKQRRLIVEAVGA